MIRARFESPWHDYRSVFDDLRNGKLSMAEYDIMVSEDALEADRRRAGLVVAVDALNKRLADSEDEGPVTDFKPLFQPTILPRKEDEDIGSMSFSSLPPEVKPVVTVTFDADNESITHAIDLVDGKAVILIRNEPSMAR